MRIICRNGSVCDYKPDELYHHGILGMRWGKKNGPPYPLGASDHSAAEKKAGYKKSIGGGRNENLYGRKAKKVANKYDKKIASVQKDIDSFDSIKDGIKDRKGRELLSKDDVAKSVSGLKEVQNTLKADKASKLAKIEVSGRSNLQKQVDNTISYAKRIKEPYVEKANELDKQANDFQKKYKTKADLEELLQYMYSSDWRNKKYMKEVWEVDDVYAHAREMLDDHIHELHSEANGLRRGAEICNRLVYELKSKKLSDFSQEDIRNCKEYSEKYLRVVASEQFNNSSKIKKAQKWLDKRNTMSLTAKSMKSSGLSYAEIAKKLGIPESSVGYYLNL